MRGDGKQQESFDDLGLSEIAMRLAAHPSKAVQAVSWVILAKTALIGRFWTQLAVAEFQEYTGLSRRSVQRGLERAEADHLIRRQRQAGRPFRESNRADHYALAEPPDEPKEIEEAAPARAGPNKEQPGEVPSTPGCERAPGSPDRDPGPGTSDHS